MIRYALTGSTMLILLASAACSGEGTNGASPPQVLVDASGTSLPAAGQQAKAGVAEGEVSVSAASAGAIEVRCTGSRYNYSLQLPDSLNVSPIGGSARFILTDGGRKIGGLDVEAMYPDQTVRNLLQNHFEIMRSVPLSETDDDVFAVVESDKPAASGDPTIVRTYHGFFPVRELGFALDLYFDAEAMSEQEALAIASTVRGGYHACFAGNCSQ